MNAKELIEKLGGIEICKKITFQKRLRQPKATHFIQHHEKRNLIQMFSRNQTKPYGLYEVFKFTELEQAIKEIGNSYD